MTNRAEKAKSFVQQIHPGAKFVFRRDMKVFWNKSIQPTNQCQIMDATETYSLSTQWSLSEEDAWVDAVALIHKQLLKKLES